MFVVANIQHRPELFWSVIGSVLNSISLLNTCTSAICAARDCNADLMSECDKIVRASCNFGSAETEDSQDATLDSVMLPSIDLGEERFREDMSRDILARMRFSSSTGFIEGVTGLEAEDPMIYGCKLGTVTCGYREESYPSTSAVTARVITQKGIVPKSS
jgi:hypothetical protein